MSRLTREDEHRLNEYNRRVRENGIDSLSEDDQLWFSLLNDRYEKFLEVGMRVMAATAQKERERESGGLFGFLANVGSSSYNANGNTNGNKSNNGNNNRGGGGGGVSNSSFTSSTPGGTLSASPPSTARNNTEGDMQADEAAGSPAGASPSNPSASSPKMDDKQFIATFGHPAPPPPPSEFPSNHWTWLQENLVLGAIPFADTNLTKDMPGHAMELQQQCLKRFCKVSLVVSCLEMDEEIPNGFCTLKDWDQTVGGGTTSFISVPLPKDPNQPIPKSLIHEVITACAQISAISHANLRNAGSSGAMSTSNNASPVGARLPPPLFGGGGGTNASADGPNNSGSATTTTTTPNVTSSSDLVDVTSGGGAANGSFSNNVNISIDDSSANAATASASSPSKLGGVLRRFTQANPKAPERKRIAYIHCKAGTQRCYVVAACYLMSQHAKPFEEVDRFLKLMRPSLRPTAQQMDFVRSFGEYITKPIVLQPRSDDEERYQTVLAEVLSLSAKGRERLLKDLEKLT